MKDGIEKQPYPDLTPTLLALRVVDSGSSQSRAPECKVWGATGLCVLKIPRQQKYCARQHGSRRASHDGLWD